MKFKAQWIAIGPGLTSNDEGQIVINITNKGGISLDNEGHVVVDSSVVRTNDISVISAPHKFLVFPELPDANPPNDLAPVTKKYLDSRVNGLVWRWPIRCQEQLASGPTGGIRPCARLIIVNSAGISAGDHIYCSFTTPDSIRRYFYLYVVDGTPSAGEIDISDNPTNDVFATRILDAIKSLAEAGDKSAMFLYNYSTVYYDRVYFIYNDPLVINDLKIWVNDKIEPCVKIDLPDHDNIGRDFHEIINNETHFVEENDVAYTWDLSTDTWIPISGISAIPFATKDTAGKVRPCDGLAVSTGDISIALSSISGLELVGTSPSKTLQISDSIAGDGLTISNKIISLNLKPDSGLYIDDTSNQLYIDPADLIDTTRGLSKDSTTNQLYINIKSDGGLLFDNVSGQLYVDPNLGEQKVEYIAYIDTLTYAIGYIVLPSAPISPTKVDVYLANGLRMISQDLTNEYSITSVPPDYCMCPESGYENYLVFANNITIGTWTSSGLSGEILAGDTLIVVYVK